MGDLICRSELLKHSYRVTEYDEAGFSMEYNAVPTEEIKNAPAVDAVPKSYADQIRLERDIAIEQLEEIGCQLGRKMDDVKKKLDAVPVVHGEWIAQDATYTRFMCSACNSKNYSGHHNFCPNCGARMDGE